MIDPVSQPADDRLSRQTTDKVEVSTSPFGRERKRCVDHGDRIAQVIKVADGPYSHNL